jgi:hypothetical protein
MSNLSSSNRMGSAACRGNHCVFAVLFLLLVRSGGVGAEEFRSAARPEGPMRPIAPPRSAREPLTALNSMDLARFPDLYTRFRVAPNSMYSSAEFRPRGASLAPPKTEAQAAEAIPALHESTMWERMAEFRSSRGIRLLTLWETSGSSLSLQTGRGGGPSLQWTSRSLGRGEGTHSLLDHFFSATVAQMQPPPHGNRAAPTSRPAHLFDRPEDIAMPRRD